jgi:hypothetical protein
MESTGSLRGLKQLEINGCSLILGEPASTSTPCRMDGMLTENTFSFVGLSHHQPQWLTLY